MGGCLGRQRELVAGVASERPRDPERMERAETMPVFEEMRVLDREERPLERREHRELVVGPLDGGERRPHCLDLFAIVERLAADEQMRNSARFDRVDVTARDILAEA